MEAAIVSYAEGGVNTVLGKLGTLLAQEALKFHGVRDKIQELKDELQSMNALLQTRARTNDHNKQVKTWMMQVREVAYDTEDCIDEFMHRIGRPTEGGFLIYLHKVIRALKTLKARHEIASKVQSIKTRVHSISERRSRYAHIDSTPEIGGSTSSYVDTRFRAKQSDVAGIEDRKERLVWLLMDENVPDLRVISLVSNGGFGKTTLAMKAYESPRVKSAHFQCRAQISVSQKFNRKALLRDILKQVSLNRVDTANLSADELVRELKGYLENKIYIIVIDDIWDPSAWDSIKHAFPNCENGSRIIVTTRINYVAELCSSSTHDYIYKIEPLSEKDSQDLFFKIVFGPSKNCPPELKKISEDILKKCGGMFLAIVSIAGLLSVKPNKSKQEWENVYNSLGSESETNTYLDGINKILSLSYHNLPYHLKTCFLYLSIFPEDYKIRRKTLVRKWVAEGFVNQKHGLSEEQVAESYFDEFVNRNLIQAVDFSIDGRVKTCRVHDMILELIVSKSVEENFISLVRDKYAIVLCDKIRRLSVQGSKQNFMNSGLYHVRSLSLFVDVNMMHKPISFSSFRLMRVLDLEDCGIMDNHLNGVIKLFLLKYLSLRSNGSLEKLPAQIAMLQQLEMLDIHSTGIKELPKGASNLRNLKHLVASYKLDISRLNLGNMKKLETLTGVYLDEKTLKSVEKMKHLTKLGFKFQSDKKEDLLRLQLSSNLYSLKLICFGGSVPNSIESLRYLEKLTLTGLTLTDIDMQKLDTLPKLLSLKLNDFNVASNQENKIFFRKDLFKCMKLLAIHNSHVRVIFEEAAAPNLEKIKWSYYDVPDGDEANLSLKRVVGIEHLRKLKEIRIRYYKTRPSTLIDEMELATRAHPNHPNIIIRDLKSKYE